MPPIFISTSGVLDKYILGISFQLKKKFSKCWYNWRCTWKTGAVNGVTLWRAMTSITVVLEAWEANVARMLGSAKLPAPDFARWLCPLLISTAIIRMIKWKNKYLCNEWEKPISFAPMRNNAELLASYNKIGSFHIQF